MAERIADKLLMTESLTVECDLRIEAPACYSLSVQVKELNGSPVLHFPNADANFSLPEKPGTYRISISLPALRLYPGQYQVKLTLCENFGQHYQHLHVVESLGFESKQDFELCGRPLGRHAGVIFERAEWRCQNLQQS